MITHLVSDICGKESSTVSNLLCEQAALSNSFSWSISNNSSSKLLISVEGGNKSQVFLTSLLQYTWIPLLTIAVVANNLACLQSKP